MGGEMKRMCGLVVVVLAGALLLAGCTNTYYAAWEKLGYHKRDILVERVGKARDGQEAAKEQFKTTLEKFKSVTGFAGGDLEAKYNELNSEYDRCEARAETVTKEINAVDDVAQALFKEWEGELDQYASADLKAKSAEELRATKARYGQLLSAMRAAESKMKPVLAAFHDQVLFLKHNLNAQAIASLEGTKVRLQGDVDKLIADMQKSIDESNRFISAMKTP
jgi:outer membrane murein-binding lipoprotein Lpp